MIEVLQKSGQRFLKQAHKGKRVIITNDKDFGDLVYLMKLPTSAN